MEDVIENVAENTPPIPPHFYPLWIKFFAVGVLAITLYSFVLLPKYLIAARKFHKASAAYNHKDYVQAAELYRSVLETIPTSKTARIGLAEIIFSNENKADDEEGMTLLEGVPLDSADWSRINKVMPEEYKKYFQNTR